MTESKKGFWGFLLGLVPVFIPVIVAIVTINLQYIADRKAKLDEHYRSLTSQLTSTKKSDRHAAAASIATYLKRDDSFFKQADYYYETVDVLATRVASEPSYDVRNSIIAALKKIRHEPEYRQVINRLLAVTRNNFIQNNQINNALAFARNAYTLSLDEIRIAEQQYSTSGLEADRVELERVKAESARKSNVYKALQKDYDELQANIPMVANMIAIFLSEVKGTPMNSLDFFRTNLNSVVLTDLVLSNSTSKWSTFSSTTLDDSVMNNAEIDQTLFANSWLNNVNFSNSNLSRTLFTQAVLRDADFSGSTFEDVYFSGADLAGTDFSNVTGLRPEYFYGSLNLLMARFDDKDIVSRVQNMTEADFRDRVAASTLSATNQGQVIAAIFGYQ